MSDIRINFIDQIKSGYEFNTDRIYEMHNLLRRIGSLRDCPGINNDIVKNTINDIHEYITKWEELKDSYPHGIPVVNPWVDFDIKEKKK